MKRVGIGGAHMADIGMAGGKTIENKIEFFTPEWFDALRHAAAESDRLGLELSIFSSSGWSLTGGPWEVAFPPNLGAPEKIRLAHLQSWTENPDDGVKYFSGTATYTKSVQVPEDWLKPGVGIVLDLGTVRDLAQVSVNGQPAASLWKPPYRAGIAKFLKAGINNLEINVTNQWTNRQLGDRQLDPERRVLSSLPGRMIRFGPPQSLSESGLIGPVNVLSIEVQKTGMR